MANINKTKAMQKITKFKKGQQIIKDIHNKDFTQYAPAERAALKEQIKNADRINISDSTKIKIPEGAFAADFYGYTPVAIKDAGGDVVGIVTDEITPDKLFNTKNKYPQIDDLEAYINSWGGTLGAYMDKDENLVYAFGTRDVNKDMFANYLVRHGIPFTPISRPNTEGVTDFIIKEKELAEAFPEYANVEPPIKKLFNAKNGYPQIDALEDYINSWGGILGAYMDKDANLVYTFGTRDVNKDMFVYYLLRHKIPFSLQKSQNTEGVTYFIIKEKELAEAFPEYANVEMPIIRRLIDSAGDINVPTTDTVAARQEIAKALAGAIDEDAINKHAQEVYDEITTILATNPEQARMLIRFEARTVEEKQKLATFIVNEYAKLKGMPIVPVEVKIAPGAVASFSDFDHPLTFNPNAKEVATAGGFVGAIAHEYAGHAADEIGKGLLNTRQMTLSKIETGVSCGMLTANNQWKKVVDKLSALRDAGLEYDTTELDEADKVLDEALIAYHSHLTEQVATAISNLFAKNKDRFVSDVFAKVGVLQEKTEGRGW